MAVPARWIEGGCVEAGGASLGAPPPSAEGVGAARVRVFLAEPVGATVVGGELIGNNKIKFDYFDVKGCGSMHRGK